MERPQALVVDRDPSVRALVREVLEDKGVMTLGASTAAEALDILRVRPVKILVADLRAPGVEAGDLLGEAYRRRPSMVRIVLAGEAERDRAGFALESGAFDVLFKPLEGFQLKLMAERSVHHVELLARHQHLLDELRGRADDDRLVGRTEVVQLLREKLQRLAATDDNVMFTGESGVGRKLAARTLHSMSARGEGRFVTLDCASLSPSSLEAELLGAAGAGRGSPTGLLESAAGGTLFLDSVTALPTLIQAQLAELLRGGRPRVAGDPHDARLVSCASGEVELAAEQGRIDEGLYELLAPVRIAIPPLRERKADIPVLALHFIETIREINKLPPIHLASEALSLLERYHWPENVRELRNAVEEAVIVAADATIRPRDLPAEVRRDVESEEPVTEVFPPSTRAFKEAKREVVEGFEEKYLQDLLERHAGNVTAAAGQAGMLRSALQRLLRKYSIRSADFRRPPNALSR